MQKMIWCHVIVYLVVITPITSGAQAGDLFATGSNSPQNCTILYATDGVTAIAGNNEDGTNPFPIVWFQPGEDGKYGGMYFGFQDFSPGAVDWHSREGGINEQGLFYDFASTDEMRVPRDPGKPDCWLLTNKIIKECSTVEEAIELFSEYNFREVWKGHYLIGDRFGNSVIIEPLTFIRGKHKYQIATNFLLSKTDPETSTDERFRVASRLFEQADGISVDLFRHILDKTHMGDYTGFGSVTLYSYICNLNRGDIYIYNFHNYDALVKLNIHEELKKGAHSILISSLFAHETDEARQYRARRATSMLLQKAVQNGMVGEDGAVAFYKALESQDDKPVKYEFEEDHLVAAGNTLLRYNKVKVAIDFLKFVVEEFPRSAKAYDALGGAYMKAGDEEIARRSYEKSLELDPGNENAKKMLDQLSK
jgi:tetratricopeptide (TPR) repeat protein